MKKDKRYSNTTIKRTKNNRNNRGHGFLKKVPLFILTAVIITGCASVFGNGFVNAQEISGSVQTYESSKCFKSIKIQPGDSLWTIAQENKDAHYASVQEYIDEIKQINNLSSDLIHSGQYLTVVYYI